MNNKLLTTLKKIDTFAHTHSQMETMAKVLTSLNSTIVGFPFRIDMNIVYCSTMTIKEIGGKKKIEIYMGSDYIVVSENGKEIAL